MVSLLVSSDPILDPMKYPNKVICAGAGNAVFPLLSANQNPDLHLYAFDYSSHAVKLVQVDGSPSILIPMLIS